MFRSASILAIGFICVISMHAQTKSPGIPAEKLSPALRYALSAQGSSGTSSEHRELLKTSGSDPWVDLIVLAEEGVDLSCSGVRVRTRIDAISTVSVRESEIRHVANFPGVRFIQRPGVESLSSESNALLMGVTDLHSGTVGGLPVTGKGVLVAIYDSGIDLSTPLFGEADRPGHVRIAAIWDQTMSVSGISSPSGFSYGSEMRQPEIDARIRDGSFPSGFAADITGHGTRVALLAAGSDASIGIAPGATLIIIKGGNDTFTESGIIDALHYVDEIALELGMPAVVNLSLGSHHGPHDGTRPYERAIDDFCSRHGRIVVVAAGNDGRSSIHSQVQLSAGDSIDIPWNLPSYTPRPGDTNDKMTLELWYEAADSIAVAVVSPDGRELRACTGRPYAFSNTSEGSLFIDNAAFGPSPLHGKNEAFIHLTDFHDWIPASGVWTLRVTNLRGTATATMHAWFTETISNSFRPHFIEGHPAVSSSALVRSPGNAESSITVGSLDTDGTGISASWFSSPGPTAAGLHKPDVAVRGNGVPVTGGMKVSGTSYAAPQVSGLVALLLETEETSDVRTVRNALLRSASSRTWNPDIGNGMPDGVKAAMNMRDEILLQPGILHAALRFKTDGIATMTWIPRPGLMVSSYEVYAHRDASLEDEPRLIGSLSAVFPEAKPDGPVALDLRGDPIPGTYIIREIDSLGRTRDFGEIRPLSKATPLDAARPPLESSLTVYPNPFNTQTIMEFSLDTPQEITVSMFDMSGRRVHKAELTMTAAGRHSIPLDAGTLSSGTYVVAVTGPRTRLTHMIQLLK